MHLTLSWDGRCASGPWYRAAGQNGDALSKLSELHRIDHSHMHISGHENKIMLVNIEQCASRRCVSVVRMVCCWSASLSYRDS